MFIKLVLAKTVLFAFKLTHQVLTVGAVDFQQLLETVNSKEYCLLQ